MQPWHLTLLSVLLVSAVPLICLIFLGRREATVHRLLPHLVSLAVGGMLGGALLHLLPESIEKLGNGQLTWLLVLAGFLAFFGLERFLSAHHHHLQGGELKTCDLHGEGHAHADVHEAIHAAAKDDGHIAPVATLNMIGDGLHNLLDGIVIAASYMASTKVGIAMTLAVILHEVPHEIGNFGVLVYSGLSIRRAVIWNCVCALTALVGAGIGIALGARSGNFGVEILPFAAGNFIYIAASDLIPKLEGERHRAGSPVQIAWILLGVGLIAVLRGME